VLIDKKNSNVDRNNDFFVVFMKGIS